MRTYRLVLALALLGACNKPSPKPNDATPAKPAPTPEVEPPSETPAEPPPPREEEFKVVAEQVADFYLLRYQVPGFEELDLEQKRLLYYLYEAALSGRDIIWDQNYRHNLTVRRTIEAVWNSPGVEKQGKAWNAFAEYSKRVWFSNGIHHHYSTRKLVPKFTAVQFGELVKAADPKLLPLDEGESVDDFLIRIKPIVFLSTIDSKRVNLDPSADLVANSANNYYGPDVTQAEVEAFYAARIDKSDPTPISWGLNSRLVKTPKGLEEQVWKVGGMYSPAIEKMVHWLQKAVDVAENPAQKAALQKLVEYYSTGDLKTFDEYSVAWVADDASRIDVINGFIEVYGDPMGYRGAYESVVSFRDLEASQRIDAISAEAQWFEDHSPIDAAYRKENVEGISAKVITVVVEAGDAAPMTPIGINLPNANWIRTQHGSKSVNLGNIVDAHHRARQSSGALEEFAYSPEEVERARAWSVIASKLHTDMHEVIGHASGKIRPGVGTPKETLKNYASALEEARADLVALYFMMSPKLIEIGVMPDKAVGQVEYDHYIRNGLMVQLARLELGEDLEEAHMRNRQMIAAWALEKGRPNKVIERRDIQGKTYFIVNDYDALRQLFGELLREVQRIKSEGDYEAAKALFETYGVKVDRKLHAQVKKRYDALGIAPYAGFLQPKLVPVRKDGAIVDVMIEYPDDFAEQMLEYGKAYSFL